MREPASQSSKLAQSNAVQGAGARARYVWMACLMPAHLPAAPAAPGMPTWYVETTMRFTPAARWMGVTAMSAMMVEQLGLAMMPPLPAFMPATSCSPGIAEGARLVTRGGTGGNERDRRWTGLD